MPRTARLVQENAIYHVTVRGNDKKDIFLSKDDYQYYLGILTLSKKRFKFKLYSYALINNHVHLLLQTTKHSSISKVMQSINNEYSRWFNSKYGRSGHLWQNRFYSKIIDTVEYLTYCIKYIELNPLKDGIVKKASEYKWSSYKTRQGMVKNNLIDDMQGVPL